MYRDVQASDCEVRLVSPRAYEECVVFVEDEVELLLTVTDEKLDGRCIVEIPGPEAAPHGWRVSLDDLRAMLDKAERLLTAK